VKVGFKKYFMSVCHFAEHWVRFPHWPVSGGWLTRLSLV